MYKGKAAGILVMVICLELSERRMSKLTGIWKDVWV